LSKHKGVFLLHYIEKETPAYRQALVSLFLGCLVTLAILYWPQPLMSIFAQQYKISPSTASFTISLTTAALAIGMLFISSLSNAFGRTKIMCISLFSTSIITILSAFSHNLYSLLFMRFLVGFSVAAFLATALTYLNEEFSPGNQGTVVGVYIAGTGVGGVFGRIVVSTLTDFFSWNIALFALGFFSLLCSVLFWILIPDSNNFSSVKLSFSNWSIYIKAGLKNKNVLYLCGSGFLLMGVFVTLLNYIAFPLVEAPYHLSEHVIGFLFVPSLLGTLGALWFGRLADKYSRIYLISFAVLLILIGSLLTLIEVLALKISGITIFAFGFFAGHAVASGWIGLIAPKEIKAQASSLYLLFYYMGSSFIGWLGGFFLSHFDWEGVIVLICASMGVLTLLLFRLNNLSNMPQEQKCSETCSSHTHTNSF